MDADFISIITHLGIASAAGGLIGLERSFHGRPAGFRTHTLVCLASSLLMLVARYQGEWLPAVGLQTIETDPTRLAQGIMTGIGFLGAGVIYQEGFSIRGLTTAASIWITAAIGILAGLGFYFPLIIATVFTLGILSAFRWIEAILPSQSFAHHVLRFDRDNAMSESEVREFLRTYGFTITKMSYQVSDDGSFFEYRMIIRTSKYSNTSKLVSSLQRMERVRAFRISPAGE